jgi:ABC-type glycerol-3-phosphate transport system substrate-binding protein
METVYRGNDMRKITTIAILAALISAGTAGVWAAGQGESPAQAPAAKPAAASAKNLLISRWAGPHADFQKQVVAKYQGASVRIDDIDYGSLKQKQITSFQASKGTGNYDVVWVNSQWMKEYVDAGYLMPIDDLIAKHGLDTSIYAAGMMDGTRFNGKTYGLPTFAQCLILAYDSAAFQAAGLAVPKTADELVSVAKYFKSKGSGIAIPAKQGGAAATLYSQLLFSSGGYYFNKAGALDLTSPESVYAATIYDQLVQNSVRGVTAWHHDEAAEAVRTKVAPIGTIMSGLANQNANPEKSLIVDTVRYATINGKTGDTAANNAFWVWAIANNSNDADESFKFISWFTSPAVEKEQTLANQQISAITSLSNDPEVLAKVPYLPVVMKQLANGKMDPALRNFGQLKDALIVGLSEIATTDADPAAVMARIQDQLKAVDFSK